MKKIVMTLMLMLVITTATGADDRAIEQYISGLSASDWQQRQQSLGISADEAIKVPGDIGGVAVGREP